MPLAGQSQTFQACLLWPRGVAGTALGPLPGCLARHRGSRGKLTWTLGLGAPSDLAFISVGNCTWGMNCRFIHPGVNDKGNYSLITKAEPFPPNGAPPLGPHPLMPANPWVREHLFHC